MVLKIILNKYNDTEIKCNFLNLFEYFLIFINLSASLLIMGINSFKLIEKLIKIIIAIIILRKFFSIIDNIKAINDRIRPNVKFLGNSFLSSFELLLLSKELFTTGAIHIAKKTI